jgi:DNA-binding NarL/FixJ family response regulator
MENLKETLLIVDDEALIVMGLSAQIEDMGLNVCATAATADEAIAEAQAHRPAVVLMDMRLRGEKDGVDAALAIHATVGSKVIFLTGSREEKTIHRINTDHPFALLFKPVSDQELQKTIMEALRSAFGE